VIPLLLHASDNSFCSDAVCFLAQMLFMLDGTLPCIIMLELLSILKFILSSSLYQKCLFSSTFVVACSFCSDAVCFLAQMLFMLDRTLPCIIILELLSILKFILMSFWYQNTFLVVPFLFCAGKNSFCSATVWLFAHKFFVMLLRGPE
jgi:hypothetical protein